MGVPPTRRPGAVRRAVAGGPGRASASTHSGARRRRHRGGRPGRRRLGTRGRRPARRAPARRGVRRPGPPASPPGPPSRSWSPLVEGGVARCRRRPPRPVFAGIAGGMARLPELLAADARRAHGRDRARAAPHRVRLGADRGTDHGARAGRGGRRGARRTRGAGGPAALHGRAAARRPSWPRSSTPRWPWSPSPSGESAAPELATTDSSGFLVPPVEGRRIKAATFSFSKWGWVRASGAGLC